MKIPEELVTKVQQARTSTERVDLLTELVLLVTPEIELFLKVWPFSEGDRKVVQQVVLKTLVGGINGVKPSNFGRWLYRVIRKAAVDRFRFVREDRDGTVRIEEIEAVIDQYLRKSCLHDWGAAEFCAMYAFAMLSENYQEVVRLRIFLGLSFSEIGDLLFESAGDVKSVFQHGLDIMRVTFELAQGGDVGERIT